MFVSWQDDVRNLSYSAGYNIHILISFVNGEPDAKLLMQGMGKRHVPKTRVSPAAGTHVCNVCHMPHICDSMLLAHDAMLIGDVDGYLEPRWV